MNQFAEQLRNFFAYGLPRLIVPIAILVIGWMVAYALGALITVALHRTELDDRIATKILGPERARRVDAARWAGKLAYYIALVFVALLFLQSLQLGAATAPIGAFLTSIFAFAPRLLGAVAILLVAWLAASLARRLVLAFLRKTDVERHVRTHLGAKAAPVSVQPAPFAETREAGKPVAEAGKPVAEVVYWIVLLLFTPAVLGALRLDGLLVPVESMIQRALAFLPNILSAALILVAGWFVARIVQRLVVNLLSNAGVDRLSARTGLSGALGKQSLSRLAGIVVYALILVPVAIGALDALHLDAVTAPASRMLQTFLGAVPQLFAAGLLLAVAYVAGRLVAGVVRNVLRNAGFDRVPQRLGFREPRPGEQAAAEVVSTLTLVAIMYFAALEAARMLGFDAVARLGTDVATLAGRILLGLAIFGLGLWLGNLVARGIRESGVAQASLLATIGRVAVLALSGAMALRQMGLANEIIELAFGLSLGAVAVAGAIAFGLGGRDAAAQSIGEARERLRTRPRPGETRHQPAE